MIREGVRISAKDDADYHDNDDNERFLLEICGHLTNRTLLIEGMGVYLRTGGLNDYRHGHELNNSTVVGHYKAEQRNITAITGTHKTLYCFSKFLPNKY